MPPLNSQSALVTPSAQLPVHNNGAPFANYPAWNNRLPESFKKLDRQFVLQSDNGRFLEMHPNGIRGVPKITEYCILYIFMLNITTLNTKESKVFPDLADFENPSATRRMNRNQTKPLKVFRSSKGNYLCMDNTSVIYQQETYDPDSCSFHHEYDHRTFRDRYYRLAKKSKHKNRPKRWYIGINKDGTIRCGNVTRKNQKGANYLRLEDNGQSSDSPPYEGLKRKCCPKNKCKKGNKKGGRDKNEDKTGTRKETPTRDKSKRCYRNWCRKRRRQFFQLKLKDVNRYYNRCIKRKKEIRHCKNR